MRDDPALYLIRRKAVKYEGNKCEMIRRCA